MNQPTPRLKPRPWSRLIGKIEPSTGNVGDVGRALPVVCASICMAIAVIATVAYTLGPGVFSRGSTDIALSLTLVGLGILADRMPFYQQGRNVVGSVALIPLVSAALILPDIRGLALIISAQILTEALRRRSAIKLLFNVAQVAIGFGAGLLLFHHASQFAFPAYRGLPFTDTAFVMLGPAALVVGSVMLISSVSVSMVVAAISRRNVFQVWVEGNKSTAAFSVLHIALTFYLTWLSINLGVIGSAGMALPLIVLRQLLRTTLELTTVTEELLDLMVAAIEARDPYTSGHSKRVAEVSRIIAQAMGLRAEVVERVTVAALLHDVGKIDEQFARVLAKEGRLTPEEWTTMKNHPVRSAELVGMLSSLQDIVPAVRHHHENWDGTGYPANLQGDSIPLASRIIMFADTLDAITTDRPYRKALGIEDARREFMKFRGKQFDPEICDRIVSSQVWATLYDGVLAARVASSEDTTARSATRATVAA